MGHVVRSQYWLLYTTGIVCAHVIECLSRRSVMVSAWTCDSLSWFQSTTFYKTIILKLSSVGCRYYETSGVVGC